MLAGPTVRSIKKLIIFTDPDVSVFFQPTQRLILQHVW